MSNRFQSLPWRLRGLRSATILFFLYLYLPIAVLFVYSFNGGTMATIWEGFSLRWYVSVIESSDFRAAATNSLIVAASAAFLGTVLATMAALGFRGRKLAGASLMMPFLSFPLVIPEIVTAVATLIFFISIGMPLGLIGLIAAHTVFCIPFAFLTVKARLDSMDEAIERAASDLYATPIKGFCYVTLPLLWPAVMSGFLLAFIVSLDDFIISLFLAGPSSTTLPIYMFGMIRLGVTPAVNAISVIILLFSLAFVGVAALINRFNRI
jgi:spermidine/putrescine transport system permease protein